MLASNRTQPALSIFDAFTFTPLRAVNRQLACSFAPDGFGSGAQTRKSIASNLLPIIIACVVSRSLLARIASSMPVTIACENGLPSEKRAVVFDAVASAGSPLKRRDDR